MKTTDIDVLLAEMAAARERRATELRDAFNLPDKLRHLILRDCAELVATMGGYAPPIDQQERLEWIRKMLRSDPFFLAKVKAAENLVREYAEFAVRPSPSAGGEA